MRQFGQIVYVPGGCKPTDDAQEATALPFMSQKCKSGSKAKTFSEHFLSGKLHSAGHKYMLHKCKYLTPLYQHPSHSMRNHVINLLVIYQLVFIVYYYFNLVVLAISVFSLTFIY